MTVGELKYPKPPNWRIVDHCSMCKYKVYNRQISGFTCSKYGIKTTNFNVCDSFLFSGENEDD